MLFCWRCYSSKKRLKLRKVFMLLEEKCSKKKQMSCSWFLKSFRTSLLPSQSLAPKTPFLLANFGSFPMPPTRRAAIGSLSIYATKPRPTPPNSHTNYTSFISWMMCSTPASGKEVWSSRSACRRFSCPCFAMRSPSPRKTKRQNWTSCYRFGRANCSSKTLFSLSSTILKSLGKLWRRDMLTTSLKSLTPSLITSIQLLRWDKILIMCWLKLLIVGVYL